MASHEKVPSVPPAVEHDDDDLDDLLDEFDEQILSKPPGAHASEGNADTTSAKNSGADGSLNDEFKHNIEDLIKDLDIEEPEAKTQFEQLVKRFEESQSEESSSQKSGSDFDNVMKQTMERLKKSGKNIDEQLKNDQSGSNPEDMLTQLLAGLGSGGSGDGEFDMSKLLTDMLEQLSSKEVLYEPIKDLNTKFPDYLKEKEGKIPAEEHANYTKQYEVTKEILAVFDAPGYDNDNPAHRDNVNNLLESLQELGNPPTELVGDENDFPGFGGGNGAGAGGAGAGLDFNSKDLPKDFEKDLEEGCKQT